MQNTYTTQVNNAVAALVNATINIANEGYEEADALDCVQTAQTALSFVVDTQEKLQFVLDNSASYTNITALAQAALSDSALDTVVREDLHELLLSYA